MIEVNAQANTKYRGEQEIVQDPSAHNLLRGSLGGKWPGPTGGWGVRTTAQGCCLATSGILNGSSTVKDSAQSAWSHI